MNKVLQIDIQMYSREHMIHTSKENKIRNINKFFSFSSSSSSKKIVSSLFGAFISMWGYDISHFLTVYFVNIELVVGRKLRLQTI